MLLHELLDRQVGLAPRWEGGGNCGACGRRYLSLLILLSRSRLRKARRNGPLADLGFVGASLLRFGACRVLLTTNPGSGRTFSFGIVPTKILVAVTRSCGLVDVVGMRAAGSTGAGGTVGAQPSTNGASRDPRAGLRLPTANVRGLSRGFLVRRS